MTNQKQQASVKYRVTAQNGEGFTANGMQFELKHLAPYLPYGLKCQYNGIINGKELSEQDKAYKKDGDPFDWNIEPVYGLKIGTIKSIHLKKDGWRVYIGQKSSGKAFYNGLDFKPILKPLNYKELSFYYFDNEKLYGSTIHNVIINIKNGTLNYLDFTHLLENHFDVFGLIEKGLAVDINSLNIITK